MIDFLDRTGVPLEAKLLPEPNDLVEPGSWRGVSGNADLSRGVWNILHAATVLMTIQSDGCAFDSRKYQCERGRRFE